MMSVKSLRKQWQREKQERIEFLTSCPIIHIEHHSTQVLTWDEYFKKES